MRYSIRKIKGIIVYALIMSIIFSLFNAKSMLINARISESIITIFFVDNTKEQWIHNDDEIKIMLSRYNGYNEVAQEYGRQAYNCYVIFDRYN